MATKITTGLIANDAITSAHIGATAITNADLHTNMDLTGKTVLVANASTGDNDTTAANTAFVQQELAALVDSAPGTLNTLNELAAALGDDAAFSTTVTNSIATKLPLAGGTMSGALNMGSQNITNAGTISSGAITSDGNLTVKGTAGFNSNGETASFYLGDTNSEFRATYGGGTKFFLNGTERMELKGSSGDLDLKTGVLQINGNTVIDTNRDITPRKITASSTIQATSNSGANAAFETPWQNDTIALQMKYDASYLMNIEFDAATRDLILTSSTGDNTANIKFRTGGTGASSVDDRMTIDHVGKVGIGTTAPDGDLHLKHGSTNAFTASNDSWHTMVIQNNASAATNTTGIAFEVSGSAYHGNAGTGIAAVKNGTASDYGADLVFITRPQSAVAAERMRITDAGNVGIGGDPTNQLQIFGGASDSRIHFTNNATGNTYADGSWFGLDSTHGYWLHRENTPISLYTNAQKRMTLDTNGDLTLSDNAVVTAIDQFQNNGITSTTSAGASWTLTTNSGTYNDRGSLEVAGISNRHVFKWGFSGNLAANTWYPFTKRSELATYGPDSGGGSEDGFAMYFRIYTYTSTSGWGEYLANRLTNMVWVGNYGSNSTQEHEFVVGPGLGHAPNGGHSADTASSNPVRMRIHHRMGSNDHPNSDQTFEILVTSALTGLNSTVQGRQLLIYGYVL